MFFKDKHKELVSSLHHKVENLNLELRHIKSRLETQTIRIDALMKAYPYGANTDGTPRKKPGRPRKVKVVV